MTASEYEKAAKYDRHLESKRRSQKKQMENDPLFKEKASIRSMKHVAKKRGDMERVKELELRYRYLKELSESHQ